MYRAFEVELTEISYDEQDFWNVEIRDRVSGETVSRRYLKASCDAAWAMSDLFDLVIGSQS